MTKYFVAGWFRVRDGNDVAVMWCRPVPAGAPRPFIIGARCQEDCESIESAAFAVHIDEFERDLVVERIAVEPPGAEVRG